MPTATSIMKQIILVLTLLCCFQVCQVQAQNPNYKYGLTVKTLFLDYQSQNGGSITDFKSYNYGYEVGFLYNIQESVNLVVPIKIGVVKSHAELNDFNKTIMGGDVQLQYQFYKSQSKIVPYIMGGLGFVTETEGDANVQAPLGAGLNFKMTDKAFFNFQSEYRFSFSQDRNNLHHALGFVYLFGSKGPKAEMPKKDEVPMGVDSDGDGLIDDIDLCPQEAGSKDMNGCPDMDGDGIADYEDDCPDYAGLKIFKGCPDSDGDGISDNEDECPNMAGLSSNKGCPDNDKDNDGVPDALDRCPDLPGSPANEGCPLADGDGDGVADKDDKCPKQRGSIAANGCPDNDNDGIPNDVDRCPNLAGISVYGGCPDTDGDGIDDGRDKCPNSAGPVSTQGCPEIEASDLEVLETAMRAVQFDTGRASLKGESLTVLRRIKNIMVKYPDFNLSINGHTDNTGSARANLQLSERRAESCYKYLLTQGLSSSRMNYTGYGESKPISDNKTLRGRALNRRTEFNLVPR